MKYFKLMDELKKYGYKERAGFLLFNKHGRRVGGFCAFQDEKTKELYIKEVFTYFNDVCISLISADFTDEVEKYNITPVDYTLIFSDVKDVINTLEKLGGVCSHIPPFPYLWWKETGKRLAQETERKLIDAKAYGFESIAEAREQLNFYGEKCEFKSFKDLYRLAYIYGKRLKHIAKDAPRLQQWGIVYRVRDNNVEKYIKAQHLEGYKGMGWNVVKICKSVYFYKDLTGYKGDLKRELTALGQLYTFLTVLDNEAQKVQNAKKFALSKI